MLIVVVCKRGGNAAYLGWVAPWPSQGLCHCFGWGLCRALLGGVVPAPKAWLHRSRPPARLVRGMLFEQGTGLLLGWRPGAWVPW